MMYEKLALLAEASGFTAWAPLDIGTIRPRQEVRDVCALNTCGKYGTSWCCPPGCGTLDECLREMHRYSFGILVQTCGEIEDSFDIETMREIEARQNRHFFSMYRELRKSGTDVLAVGSGGCTVCETCTYPDAPCRFPDKKAASMEAYGILVLEVCKANGLRYYYGTDRMSYTSCFLVR